MAVVVPPAPQAVAENALGEAIAVRRARTPADSGFRSGDHGGGAAAPAATDPLPIYSVALDTLAADPAKALKEAQQHGWRVLTTVAGDNELVDLAGVDDQAQPVAVRRGRSADILVRAGALAEANVPTETEFQARVLEFGRLGMAALWLHNDDPGTPDRFFTLEPDQKEREQTDLLGEAQSRAQRRLESDERTRAARTGEESPSDLGG